jgi:hypothetical protein
MLKITDQHGWTNPVKASQARMILADYSNVTVLDSAGNAHTMPSERVKGLIQLGFLTHIARASGSPSKCVALSSVALFTDKESAVQ